VVRNNSNRALSDESSALGNLTVRRRNDGGGIAGSVNLAACRGCTNNWTAFAAQAGLAKLRKLRILETDR
jgi:hypothetical protein